MRKGTIRTKAKRPKQAVAIHTWKPWKHSTGPKTEDGKMRSARNAWKHGRRNWLVRTMATVKAERGKRIAAMQLLGTYIPPGSREKEADGRIQRAILKELVRLGLE